MSDAQRSAGAPLTEMHDVALLDLDGVVYIGTDVVPGAPEALAAARERGMRLAFVTNNASRPPHEVVDHLRELGITAKLGEVVTSAQAAARYLADRLPGGARVLVVGSRGLVEALRERGLVPVEDAQGQVDAVVQGYSPELTWSLMAEGAVAINQGVPWVATNADRTIPSARGPLPGNGAFVAAMRYATGREPVVTGKPDPTMHRESLLRSNAERPIVVGDRLDTDIEGATAVGCASLLVLTGVTTPRDLIRATARERPTYVSADLRGLLVPHPQARADGNSWRCGSWLVRRRGSELRLAQDDRDRAGSRSDEQQPDGLDDAALDALRALCAASWSGDSAAEGADSAEETAGIVAAGEYSVLAAGDAAQQVVQALGLED